jgi:tetratricopeptide (TPR) repeat protein
MIFFYSKAVLNMKPENLKLFLAILLFIRAQVCFSQYREIDSLESILDTASHQQRVDILVQVSIKYLALDVDSALSFAQRAKAMAEEIQYYPGLFDSYNRMKDAYTTRNDDRNSLIVCKKMLDIATEIRDSARLGIAHFWLAVEYKKLNTFSKAIAHNEKALQIAESRKDEQRVISCLNGIGTILSQSKQYEKALTYYQRVIERTEPNSFLNMIANVNAAETYREINQLQKALLHVNSALKICESYFPNHSNVMAFILLSKGRLYHKLGDYAMTKRTIERSLQIYTTVKSQAGAASCQHELARVAIAEGRLTQATMFLNEAHENVKSLAGNHQRLVSLYSTYAELAKAQGKFDDAFAYLEKQNLFKDSVIQLKEREAVQRFNVLLDVKEAELTATYLKAENKNNVVAIILLVVLIISILTLVITVSRAQLRRIRSSESQKKILLMNLNSRLETETHLKSELDQKAKEMTSLALNMIQKREILESIRAEIENLCQKVDGESKASLKKIVSTIRFSEHLEKDWQTFRRYFDQVHQGFFDNLQALYPDLNSNDLKFCALLKLNLDTKQLASVLDISAESVKVAKHRIRKKLGLTGEDNMTAFFNTIRLTSNQPIRTQGG